MIQITLKIDGMMCGMCESHINDAIRNAFSVKKVSASETGYTVTGVKVEAIEKKPGLFGRFGKK